MWSNYPASNVPGLGVFLGEISAARDAAMALLRAVLSPQGYGSAGWACRPMDLDTAARKASASKGLETKSSMPA